VLSITWESAQPVLDRLKDTEYLIGFTSEGMPVTFDLASDRPHVHIVTSSGGGATSLLNLFARQMDTRNTVEQVHIIGPTRISAGDSRIGFGKVVNSRGSIEETPRVVAEEWKLMAARLKDGSCSTAGRRILLIDRLDKLAHRTRAEKAAVMFDQLEEIMTMGRAFGLHVIASSYVGADQLGKTFTDNFGTEIVSRVTERRWAEVQTTEPMPEEIKDSQRGIYAVVRDGRVTVTRAVYSE
jgi:hypothetical protein